MHEPANDPRPSTAGDRVIEVQDLRMRYGTNDVLRGVDLDVDRGEVIALLGPNGAGKTTTIEILEGFRRRSGGEVRVLGQDPIDADEDWRARIGVVLQSWRDHARWSPRALLEHLGAYYRGYATPDRPRPYEVDDLVALVGMGDFVDARIGTLSGGQRRRLDVAVGILGRPELLFLDEPTAGLDPHARREFHELVHRLSDLEGATILLTTHDLAEAEKLSDRILILAGGKIAADGSPDALAQRIAAEAEVRWTQDGQRFVHTTADPTAYVRDLLTAHRTGITDLEVRRATLEDTYLELVSREELGTGSAPGQEPTLTEVDA
nr:ABC transporter ATP-binding protein [Nitriliruptor alkaliphilus]